MKHFLLLPLIFVNCVGFAQVKDSMATEIQLGDSTVKILQISGRQDDQILFINVHEDEQTSIEVVEEYAKDEPLHFIRFAHRKTRNITFSIKGKTYEFDPNRIYTRKGRKATLNKFGETSWRASLKVRKLAKGLTRKITSDHIVVAMHNNTDVNYTIKSYQEGGGEFENTQLVYVNPEMDADDFIYTTYKPFYDEFVKRKINVILQDNDKCVNDGSLSVYCGKKGVPYINIEAQKGHFDQQMELLRITLEVLRNEG